jgi:beta-lactamase regulating signal transducer with metallopeptidase domain
MTAIALATTHWIAALPQLAAGAFVSSVWQGLLLTAAVWLCLRLVPRTTAAIRFGVWTAVFLVLALLPFLHAYAHTEQALPHAAILQLDPRWSFAVAGLWILLSLIRAASLAASGFRLHQIWRRATPLATDAPLLSAANLRRVQLCTSPDVLCPSMIGFFSPRILIPTELNEHLTKQELEQIVHHEMGHLRRRDDWFNLLQKIGLVLFPLNPALAWIERRLCFERELACDDAVLQCTRAPKAYAKCLTTLAEQRLHHRALSLTLGAWERQSELARRVHSILQRSEPMGRTQSRVLLAVLTLALFGGAAELSRCPQFVSFSNPATSLQTVAAAPQYQPVVSTSATAAHETLLKASMPSQAAAAPIPAVRRKPRRAPTQPLRQANVDRAPAPQMQQWVVLTSTLTSSPQTGTSHISRMVLTAPAAPDSLPAFAAVPTDLGWLIIQL